MTNASRNTRINHQEVTKRNRDARRIVAGFESAMPTLADIWRLIDNSLADAPTLAAEIDRLRAELDDTRLDRANLLAAARATIGAYHDGEPDPLSYLRDELAARGQLPPTAGGRR